MAPDFINFDDRAGGGAAPTMTQRMSQDLILATAD
jgi:hypothetical protein